MLLSSFRSVDPFFILAPIVGKCRTLVLREPGEIQHFADCSPCTVERTFDPRMPWTDGFPSKVEESIRGGSIEANVWTLEFSRTEESKRA